jgi:hypothetical protein
VVWQIELRRQAFTVVDQNLDMDVRRTPGVGHRFYSAKGVSPVGFADVVAVSLKAVITRRAALVSTMQIASVYIALPDLDARARDRFAARFEHSAGKRNNLATSLLDLTRDLDQITIDVIEAHPRQRVEWSLGSRRRRVGRGESGNRQCDDAAQQVATQLAATVSIDWIIHGTIPGIERLQQFNGSIMKDKSSPSRDFIGYADQPPTVVWPDEAQVAINFCINYEEGGELCILNGDDRAEHDYPLGDEFFSYLKDSFDTLYGEGESHPRMMTVGLHARLLGRPGRIGSLHKFLDYL